MAGPHQGLALAEVTTDIAVGKCARSSFLPTRRATGLPLPQKPPHHERDGPRRADSDRVDHTGLAGKISKLIPDYMVMGERGMADMAEMEMPLPDNTLPMMTGQGPYGPVEMGGMFTLMKVRASRSAAIIPTPAGSDSRPAPWRAKSPAHQPSRCARRRPLHRRVCRAMSK